jgi:hypothetical protein
MSSDLKNVLAVPAMTRLSKPGSDSLGSSQLYISTGVAGKRCPTTLDCFHRRAVVRRADPRYMPKLGLRFA